MYKRKHQRLNTLLLTIFITLSATLSIWASPSNGPTAVEAATNGPGETAVEVIIGDAAKPRGNAESQKQGTSLGVFTTTGYCNCSICSAGHDLTYSGTAPKANHTLSADISLFPIGTKLMIHGTIYTVEDIGAAVDGHKVDIYYDSHDEAIAHGSKQEEVFMVE